MTYGEPMKMTELQVKDRLDKWFGLRFATYPQPMIDAIKIIVAMPPDQREATAQALKGFFCVHCGSDDLGCQCWNDE